MLGSSRFRSLACACAMSACTGTTLPKPLPPSAAREPLPARGPAASAAPGAPSVEEARAFFAHVDADLRRLWIARDRAAWVSENFITDDTEALAAAAQAQSSQYVTRAIVAARRFADLQLPEDLARQRTLLELAETVPAPDDPAQAEELASVVTAMTTTYGKAQVCPDPGSALSRATSEPCLHLDELSDILEKSHDEPLLREAWTAWHDQARGQRSRFDRYVALSRLGAQAIGFHDLGELWRAGYDETPAALEADVERLWREVKPLYEQLHCYVRSRLRRKYGAALVPDKGPIPVHLLGNMWGQEWTNLEPLVAPYPGEAPLDVTKQLVRQKIAPEAMVKIGERFFTSLGFAPLPETFWQRSLFVRPKDREVVCHASAWDVNWADDLRIKMCIRPNEADLITIHHELGHDFYFQQYEALPVLFQQGANDGFHEGIGDTLALSVTPRYLHDIGLLPNAPDNPREALNHEMKLALEKVAFLPFGLVLDKWRWEVFAGTLAPSAYNTRFWELRREYQGVAPPSPRAADDFDPAAKFHIASSTPYLRYFLAAIYQFQFHRALCRAAGQTGPLDRCSIYGSAAAGEKLRAMLALGASKPWQDALFALSGERSADASALLEYFAPLRAWLEQQNQHESCGF